MNGLNHIETFLVFSAMAAISSSAFAGEIGQTSRTSISISVTVPPRVLVSGVADVKMADLLSQGSSSQAVCVLTNSPESTYSVTLAGAEAGIGASLANEGVVPASVVWSDQSGRSAGVQIARGETVAGFKAASTNTCHVDEQGGAELTIQAEDGVELSLKKSVAPLTILIASD